MKKLETGMATLNTAVAISIVTFLAIIATQYLAAPSQLASAQNYADLSAISAAQLIQNSAAVDDICKRIAKEMAQDSNEKVTLKECAITGETVQVVTQYHSLLPFLTKAITAKATAGPAPEN